VTRSPLLRIHDDELILDSFAGGGGASLGIEWALGRSPDKAINHDPPALAMHAANHPDTEHILGSVWDQRPRDVCGRRRVALAWWSPDCTHHSNARGGKPKDKGIRALADVALTWAREVRPRVNVIENVKEFCDWGPLDEHGKPISELKGMEFKRWWREWEALGYAIEMRKLKACDFGTPTSRERIFIITRCDGEAIVWPEPTHGPGLLPYRTAAECIDWSVPCPSIFTRKKPLVVATHRRIARGVRRYVIESASPFIVPYYTANSAGGDRIQDIDRPLPTVPTENRFGLVAPTLVGIDNKSNGASSAWPADEPLRTVTAENRHALVASTLINTRNGERAGQAPRVHDIQRPMPTVTSVGSQGALVAAFLAKHYGGGPNGVQTPGIAMTGPLGAVTAADHHALIASSLVKYKGTCADGQPMTEPLGTVQAQGNHYAQVCAFMVKYYGADQDPRLENPLHTITAKARFGLVTVHGVEFVIVDIGMRMLIPRELFRAQGFPDSYIINPMVDGKPLGITEQIDKCGNSVCPPMARAIVAANFAQQAERRVAL
jgi:DNA (cytosine-5)-methyltransferase 1